jgi:hypothetical protein
MPDLPLPDKLEDIVTPRVASILREIGPAAYAKLVVKDPTPAGALAALGDVKPQELISKPITHPDDADAALAGLWLWLDGLEECHRIAQDIVTPTGSMWHAIMHRREGDFSNAKYWYQRCPTHHVNRLLGSVVSSMAGGLSSDRLVARALDDRWNPNAFVDLVEAVHSKPSDPRYDLAVRWQRAEWEALFSYCLRAAIEDDKDNLDAWDRRVMHPGGGDSPPTS